MKFIGGCAASFSPAACEVAAPIGKVKRRKTSNNLENRHFIKKEIAKRTIKLPQLSKHTLSNWIDCQQVGFRRLLPSFLSLFFHRI
ncbi:hypothetical protein [Rhizobium leguminosarum]|uniref:hypothetical protein n=1 Tax=Rhizobium TaxID=379 RepID=UPI00195462DE|nr:hypothetical protein [Rhizobium leguminosarum]